MVKELRAAGMRPREVLALVQYKRKATRVRRTITDELDARWSYCYRALCDVSRSFSVVIMELEPELRHPVCIFYLVLRALDTVEDDTKRDADERAQLCMRFHEMLDGEEPLWSSELYGDGAEKELCTRFPTVIQCYRELDVGYRRVIAEMTRRMGAGMAAHIRDVECEMVSDYDAYCHHVAGLVGYGLSDIFSASGREAPYVAQRRVLSNSMGLFLQKTNIVRDYLEDIEDGRTFWPREIWSQYAKELGNFRAKANRPAALACLNHLVMDSLRHVPDCLSYMKQIRTQNVFNFVTIPQVMAIATLAECYNNGKVFEGVVKIRRSLTARLVLETRSMDDLYQVFFDFAVAMLAKVDNSDPNAGAMRKLLNELIDICQPHVSPSPNLIIPNVLSIVAFCGLSSYVLKRRQDHFDGAVFSWRSAGGIMEPMDMLAISALFLVCVYMFGFFLLPYMSMMQKAEVRRLEAEARDVDQVGRVVSLE